MQASLNELAARGEDAKETLQETKKKMKSVREELFDAIKNCEAARIHAAQMQKLARGVGGSFAGVTFAGGIIASVIAGVVTMGIGAVVGVSVTAVASSALGVGATVGTAIGAHDLTKAIKSLKQQSCQFDTLLNLLHTFDEAMHDYNVKCSHAGREIRYLKQRSQESEGDLSYLTRLAEISADLKSDELERAILLVQTLRQKINPSQQMANETTDSNATSDNDDLHAEGSDDVEGSNDVEGSDVKIIARP